ncbi:hypothetical protein PT974_10956 [Cladobotryum mycophilum]|uniref:NACHT domain-containing protein n=1 Tax=Cladobotryum mycophilum TaxID=491253 RepID=A0ABR0SB90_9HYPO
MSSSESNIIVSDNEFDIVVIDRDDVSNYNPEQILPQSPQTIQEIRSWLQPTSYDLPSGEYRKHLASHVAGTGTWLTSSVTYKEWLQSAEHGLLWIKGIPGSGKSVTAANLIYDIASLSMETLWRDLQMAFDGLSEKVFCVADALDEIDQGNDTFLQALDALGQWRPEKVKVLITSRPVPSVEGPLRKIPGLHLRLKENLVDVDIATYVQFALSNSKIPQSQWQTIADAVPGRANGLFLYAKLTMDAFLEPGADIDTVLSQLPADLNALYTDLLKEHGKRSRVPARVQHLILQSVTHTARPLRLLELAEMIRVSSPDGSTRDLKTTKDLIRAACGPLLEILPDETVSVIHHSFTEYLKDTTRSDDGLGYPVLQMGSTHAQLALACLRYLQAGCLDGIKIKINDGQYEENSDFDDEYYFNLPLTT